MSKKKAELPVEEKKIEVVIPSEAPIYRYEHPYGSIAVYVPSKSILSPEKLLFLLEKAKYDLFYKKIVP